MTRTLHCLLLIIGLSTAAISQPEEFKTIDGIIEALYSSISGPAGERDWDYFRSIYKPNAIMGAMSPDGEGNLIYKSMLPESYITNNGPFFIKNGFWEKEIGREQLQFGSVAHVFSAYEFKLEGKAGIVNRRGINSIQLVFDNNRWWIVSIQWDIERDDNPIPATMLNKD